MAMKRSTALLAAVFVFALGATCAEKNKHEDTNTRSVQGVVMDAGDNPVVGAVVQLKDTKTLQVRSFITQDKGSYHFAGLSTNVDYELKAEHDGASSGTKTLSVFDSRKQANINLKLDKK
jgi:hypothetical protein